jgi:hypothetical protein
MRLSFDNSGLASTAMQGQRDAIAAHAANENHYRVQVQHKPRRQNSVVPGCAATQQLVIQIGCPLFLSFVRPSTLSN